MSLEFDIFVHPRALCESEQVGPGTRIWAFAHVMKGAVIGRDCNIGDHAFIEAGARIGDRVTVKNQAMVWDGVDVGDDVFVGPGASFTTICSRGACGRPWQRLPHAIVTKRAGSREPL
jgi:UDP-2-acetamido-3-amino-2,3-dideoxy-glucuronate N-acetyltransferase